MKNTILYKLLKWILGGSAVTFFAILISGVIFILSRYPDILEYREMKINWSTQLRDCYNLFINSDTIPLSDITMKSDTSHYCHILMLDRTMSGKYIDETKLDALKDSLHEELFIYGSDTDTINLFTTDQIKKANKDFLSKDDKKFPIQFYLTLKYYHKLAFDTKQNGLIVGFFDGNTADGNTANAITFWKKTGSEYAYNNPTTNEDRKKIIRELAKEPLLVTSTNQTSDFQKLFDEINKTIRENANLKKSNIILTIISDFYHDAKTDITKENIAKFRRGNQGKISQYNLIHCIPSVKNNKEKSQKLIDDLMNELEGLVNLVPISTEEYSKVKSENQSTFLNNEFSECLNPVIKDNRRTIKFNYPDRNNQSIEITQAHIHSKKNKFKWHLKTLPKYADSSFFISYRTDKDKEFEKIPLVSSGFKDDATDLYFEIETGILDDLLQKRIMLKTQSNDIYGIHYFNFLEANLSESFKQLAITILNGLCLSLILIFISGTVLLCFYLNEIESAGNNWFNGIGGGIILLVNGYAIYFLCPCSNCYLWTTFLIVLGCFIANVIYIYLFIRKKWAK